MTEREDMDEQSLVRRFSAARRVMYDFTDWVDKLSLKPNMVITLPMFVQLHRSFALACDTVETVEREYQLFLQSQQGSVVLASEKLLEESLRTDVMLINMMKLWMPMQSATASALAELQPALFARGSVTISVTTVAEMELRLADALDDIAAEQEARA